MTWVAELGGLRSGGLPMLCLAHYHKHSHTGIIRFQSLTIFIFEGFEFDSPTGSATLL